MKRFGFIIFCFCATLFGEPPEKFDTLIPKEPKKTPGKIIDDFEPQQKISDDNQVLVEQLKQIVLIAHNESISSSYKGNIVFSKELYVPQKLNLESELQEYIGQPVTVRRLSMLTHDIEEYYQEKGYPLVVVSLKPNQNISGGKVVIVVLIARMGDVKAEGAKYFSNKKIAKQIRTKKGAFIQADPMISDLSWINSHSFYSTNLIYEKGKNLGETDILLKTQDRFPLRPYVGYENTGNQTVGVNRFFIGFNWGQAFMLDNQELNYQFTMAQNPKEWYSHSASYQIFLPWRHRLQAFGFYSHTDSKDDPQLHLAGKSWQLCGRYLMPFIKWKIHHQFTLGYDFKRTNNFLSFLANSVFNNYIEVSQFLITYDGQVRDSAGVTTFGLRAVGSPGNMTPHNTNHAFRKDRAKAKADYVYSQFFLERLARLFYGFSWYFKASMQLSTARLLPSEEMSIAGYQYVRGYYENEIIGDEGVLIKNEIRLPAFTIKKAKKKSLGEIQFLAFVDYGKVWTADPNIENRNASALASAGPGFRYNLNTYITARLDWGFRFSQPHTNSKKHKSQFHASIIASY